MLQVKNLSFQREKKILDKVNFSLKKGAFHGIVGPSGEGKSTLLKVIAGFLDPDSGEVCFNKAKVLGPSEKLIAGNQHIQLLNQDFSLDIYHTVYENLRVKTNHLEVTIREDFILELLELLELKDLIHQQAYTLSGGEQQRLALGRALAIEPEILLLDEPFAHLDAHLKRKVAAYLLSLNKIRNTIIVLVSHDGQEILHLCNSISFFKNGKFQRTDSPQNFYLEPSNYEEGLFFGELNKVKIKNKTHLFRPQQYHLKSQKNSTELVIKFQKELFYGEFTLGMFKYKKQVIYLQKKIGTNFNEINSIYINV